MSETFKDVYSVFVGGCSKMSLTSITYSGDKDPTMYLNHVDWVVMLQVSNCALTCVNHSCRSMGQNSESFNQTIAMDEAG